MHRGTDVIAAGRFTGERAAEYRVAIPVGALAAGAYLLEVEATAGGRAAARHVSFTVR